MESNQEFKLGPIQERWLKSLEDHPERQTAGELGRRLTGQDLGYQACCLGEYLICAGLAKWERENDYRDVLVDTSDNGNSVAYGDLDYHWKFLGLYSPAGQRRDGKDGTLAVMNDSGATWPEIAAIIRKGPSMYLIKSI